ncbi:MAG: HAMP domain-containing histidine kinase [Acidobacteria bacterium]|nr:HAMP domain-containing histidine kinase [Acidobacteriota bacterium]
MAERRRWFRSLYWRIGLGFILLLAALLVSQAASFLWIAAQTEGGQPERMGQDFADLVAAEFESALADDPSLDLAAHARTRVSEFHRPAFIILRDRTVIGPPGEAIPPGLERFAAMPPWPGPRRPPFGPRQPRPDALNPDMPGSPDRFAVPDASDQPGRPDEVQAPDREGAVPGDRPMRPGMPRDDGPAMGGPFPGPPGPPPMFGRRRLAIAPVRAPNGQLVAVVFVSPVVGLRRLTEELGPWLAIGALLLLAGGTALAALLVFRPAHADLRALEAAARRFGDGDLDARAPAGGADEIAAVAHAFNRMADDLTARHRQLAEADRARRQLLADVSHELMTPLTAIRGYAETLALPTFGPASPDGQRAVQVIQEEGERIERLVGDLLDLSRYEAAGVSLQTVTVGVAELFDRVVARHGQAAASKGVAIDVRLPDEAMTIVADPHRLEQALQNLASNALRHTPTGGRIRLEAEQTAEHTTLRVHDTGIGIAAEHLPHVFDRFYKADPSRTETGSGLGLSIVKAIVERHGGHVSVQSAADAGTTFEIVLPGHKPQATGHG